MSKKKDTIHSDLIDLRPISCVSQFFYIGFVIGIKIGLGSLFSIFEAIGYLREPFFQPFNILIHLRPPPANVQFYYTCRFRLLKQINCKLVESMDEDDQQMLSTLFLDVVIHILPASVGQNDCPVIEFPGTQGSQPLDLCLSIFEQSGGDFSSKCLPTLLEKAVILLHDKLTGPVRTGEVFLALIDRLAAAGAEAHHLLLRLEPVSYTHLDVYKRQVRHRPRPRQGQELH